MRESFKKPKPGKVSGLNSTITKEEKQEILEKHIGLLEKLDYSHLNKPNKSFGEESFIHVFEVSAEKSVSTIGKALIAGILGGFFIGIGYIGCIYALRAIPTSQSGVRSLVFGAVFPIAILMITFIGGGLFTSNAIGFLPVALGNVPLMKYFQSLFLVLVGNFLGCALAAGIVWIAEIYANREQYYNTNFNEAIDHSTWGWQLMYLYEHKVGSLGFEEIPVANLNDASGTWTTVSELKYSSLAQLFISNLASGILCNVLVAASLWLTYCTKNAAAIILLLSCDIFVFAISGFSHVVANSFVYFMGIFSTGMQFQDGDMVYRATADAAGWFLLFNLLPAMIGNLLGGGFLLPFLVYLFYRQQVVQKSNWMKLEQCKKMLGLLNEPEWHLEDFIDQNFEKENWRVVKEKYRIAKSKYYETKEWAKEVNASAHIIMKVNTKEYRKYKAAFKEHRKEQQKVKKNN